MSEEYDSYLEKHKENIQKGYIWLRTNLPKLFINHPVCVFERDQSRSKTDEHSAYIKFTPKNREIVENVLWELRGRLAYNVLAHHGIKGQKWGVRNGPPYPIDHSQNNNLKNAVGKSIIKVVHTSLTGEPNSITQVTNKKGGIDRNYYDEDGRQIKQISNNDHGYPKAHKYGNKGEHAHDYIYDDSGELLDRPTRELNDKERKENGDIL